MKASWKTLLAAATLAAVFALGGCEGDDGAIGATGPAGADGAPGADGVDATADPITMAKVESCATCHGPVGDMHQAEYNKYSDTSDLGLTIEGVSSIYNEGTDQYAVTMTVEITKGGVPFIDTDGLPALNQKRFYITGFDGTAFPGSMNFSLSNPVALGGGLYTVTGTTKVGGYAAAPEDSDAQAYAYVGDTPLHTEGMTLYSNVANAGLKFGEWTYTTLANVSGCENCHGMPYMKHGYRAAAVVGLDDFAACKSCHYDDRNGGHKDWQYMVDEPYNWATDEPMTADYTYVANVMNDTHMSHAMEFPYPQSMANCETCHAGNLTEIMADANFTAETCKSCHAVQGLDAWPSYTNAAGVVVPAGDYYQSARAPAMEAIWTAGNVAFHDIAMDCQDCHDGRPGYPLFADLHSGFDKRIADEDGNRYADDFTASIDDISIAGTVITVDFSVSDPAIVPYIYLSMYGWDSNQFIVSSHSRDANGLRYEAKPGDVNALFEFTSTGVGTWTVDMDLATYAANVTNDIPTLIADGVVKNAMVTIAPRYTTADGVAVGLDAVTASFDVATAAEVEEAFIADTEKCEACHDKLAVTFHGGSGRSTVQACKNCHVTTSGGSHLEMQSRSLDSYIHATHSFQVFDLDDAINSGDPVEIAWAEIHMEHTFPNFTILNCEACHESGMYNVPDQSKSLPGLLSASYDLDRAIGSIPEAVTGPASRACGGCHRADLINEDAAGELASFDAHTQMGGTYVENDAEDTVLYGVIDKIMSLF
jgi:OmcA/MtrC family decaheme c-type cytochrome